MNRSRTNKDILDRFLAKSKNKEDAEAKQNEEVSSYSYAILRNIPKELHSKDLRKYFKRFIEAEKFACFHYRHRPELQTTTKGEESSESKTCCCLISLKTKEDREEFIGEFHKRNWINSSGSEISRRCFVDRLKVHQSDGAGTSNSISMDDLNEMIELKPPAVMPNGNIGTPSQYFLEQIRQCRLPASVIAKLGIETQKKKKKFGEVPFEYEGSEGIDESSLSTPKLNYKTIEDVANEKEDPTETVRKNQNPEDNDEGKDDDDDQCEEWERHEALHEDVTEQDRAKPRKYEEEMEVTWEKGGPGLVWYTDKNYWDEREKGTDCDWAWADDWDVDYSVYYEGKSAGDMDARAAIEMKNDELMRSGKLDQSVFTKRKPPHCGVGNIRKRRNSDGGGPAEKASENLHKGVGGKMLTKMGWKPGSGLGKNEQGKIVPVAVYVEEDGQSSREKTGFGYRGEKLSRLVQKQPVRHVIASVFDEKTDLIQSDSKEIDDSSVKELLFRSLDATTMKYRN
uniref:G-patch domain-containing protein n=1 Tax=Caenorhabditis tropicalis TaxID=1561998 RepID=A0A1I7U7Z3_9PELO